MLDSLIPQATLLVPPEVKDMLENSDDKAVTDWSKGILVAPKALVNAVQVTNHRLLTLLVG